MDFPQGHAAQSRPGSVLKPKPHFWGNRTETETSVLTGVQVGFEAALG